MSEPFALLPLAAAAAGGRVDGYEAAQLVAASLTLLQRSMPLGRALGGRRAEVYAVPEPLREHDIGVRVAGAVTAARAWREARLGAYKQPSVVDVAG